VPKGAHQRNDHYRTGTQYMVKKSNADCSEMLKRLQVKYVVVGESFSPLPVGVGRHSPVDNKSQAWHPLKVLDTIEIFLGSLGCSTIYDC